MGCGVGGLAAHREQRHARGEERVGAVADGGRERLDGRDEVRDDRRHERRVRVGERVVCVPPDGLGSRLTTDARWVHSAPEGLSPEAAVSGTMVYATAWLGLVHLARVALLDLGAEGRKALREIPAAAAGRRREGHVYPVSRLISFTKKIHNACREVTTSRGEDTIFALALACL